MKCPRCSQSISLFSKALNSWRRQKKCPHCAGEFRIFLSWKWAAILFIPAVIASVIANRAFGTVGSSLVMAIVVVLCMRLKAA